MPRSSLNTWNIISLGWTSSTVYKEREQLLATLLLHEIIWKREAAINQIMQGLAVLDVLDFKRKYPNSFRQIFVASNISVTSSTLLDVVAITEPSNAQEEKAKIFFQECVQDNVKIPCGEGNLYPFCCKIQVIVLLTSRFISAGNGWSTSSQTCVLYKRCMFFCFQRYICQDALKWSSL